MIVIYSSVRNETRILEWVNYHIKLGVGHIILLDDNDVGDNSLSQSLMGVKKSLLTIIRDNKHNNLEHIKLNYSHSLDNWETNIKPRLITLNAKYLLKIDADEFLYLNKFTNIRDMIHFYKPFDAILINWLIFGGSNLKINDQNTVTNVFTKSNNKLHFHIKSLARVSSIIDFNNNAHTFKLKQSSIVKDIDNNVINKNEYLQLRTQYVLPSMDYKNRIYIAHYVNQDYYTFIKRKFLDNISEIYFNHKFFNNIPLEDKQLFTQWFLATTELSLNYMNILHLSKTQNKKVILSNTDLKGRFRTPVKIKLRLILDAIFEYYYYMDKNANNITNTDMVTHTNP